MASLVMRWWLVCTALLLAVSAERAATTTGVVQPRNVRDEGLLQELPATIARALNRIRESKRDYHLVDDLWLEALPENADSDTKRSAFKSPSNSVVDLADSVFDTHRLSWHNSLVQGLDFNIYKDHTQKYVFDLTRQNENSHLSGKYNKLLLYKYVKLQHLYKVYYAVYIVIITYMFYVFITSYCFVIFCINNILNNSYKFL